jgi:hypothetical protein
VKLRNAVFWDMTLNIQLSLKWEPLEAEKKKNKDLVRNNLLKCSLVSICFFSLLYILDLSEKERFLRTLEN